MPIEMPRGLPFSVDTWTPSSDRKRHHFLTHAHKDHLAGVAAHASYPIYSTRVTVSLVLRMFPQVEEALFVEIEVGKSVVVRDPDGDFSVTAFDANHCPGAVMFLFEGEFGNVLHTGDCRLSFVCLQNLPLKYITKTGKQTICRLDYMFLDCTFGRCPLKIPCKHSAIQQVINCIWKHPNAPMVYLASDMLGQEEVLIEVSRTFGSKIYVDRTTSADCFEALMLVAPEILSEDASSRFQVIEGYPRLYERASSKLAEARAALQPEPLFLRPSAQWYACDEGPGLNQPEKPNLSEAVKDEYGVWHVCYSMHSSREELEAALQLLQPKWVISTTPPCRAMELNYVKKHCFKTQINSDDPLWKLLKVGNEKSVFPVNSNVSQVSLRATSASVHCMATGSTEGDKLQLRKTVESLELQLETSPRERPITLFGRARLSPHDYNMFNESEIFTAADSDKSTEVTDNGQHNAFSSQYSPSNDATGFMQVPCSQHDNVKDLPSENVTDMRQVSCSQSVIVKGSLSENVNNSRQVSVSQDDCVKDFNLVQCIGGDSEVKKDVAEVKKYSADVKNDVSVGGSSKTLSESLRKLYRSMNVPVPRPLPSLTEFMDVSRKRAKTEI